MKPYLKSNKNDMRAAEAIFNFLYQATIHHGIEKWDLIYKELENCCVENWSTLVATNQLLECFVLVKKLWPIYSALALYRLMNSVDPEYFKHYYAHKSNRLAGYFREYITSTQ
jgi:hypothetical protein